MGRYIEWDDVTARYRNVAKEFDSPSAFAGFIDGAEAEVDARLADKYAVPFSASSLGVPALVRDLAVDLTYYRMAWRSDEAEKILSRLQSIFDAVNNGSMKLVTSSGVYPTTDDSDAVAWASSQGYHSSFGPDDPVNWSPSSSWMQYAEDQRGG